MLLANIDLKHKKLDLHTETIVMQDGVTETVSAPSVRQFDQDSIRKALAGMLILDELPFKFMEREGFRFFCKAMNPHFIIPSRFTTVRDCYTLFIKERKKLKNCFKKLFLRICLTTDLWIIGQNLNYMCLTVHFIYDGWNLHKKNNQIFPYCWS